LIKVDIINEGREGRRHHEGPGRGGGEALLEAMKDSLMKGERNRAAGFGVFR